VGELALAAVLSATILLASTVSIETGLAVALIELAAGVAVGNVFTLSIPDWLSFVGSFRGNRAHVSRGDRGGCPPVPA
jgi:hypothetical protein